jgi:hypothetical protein
LSGWRERWFYIGNHEPSLPEKTAGALKITTKWSKPGRDESQILELLAMIKKQRDTGVASVTVMYSWIGSESSHCRNDRGLASSTLES